MNDIGLDPAYLASVKSALGLVGLAPYWAPICSRSFVPTDAGGNSTTNTKVMGQTHHLCMDTQTGILRVTWPNYRKPSDGVASPEIGSGAAANGRASVLYTDGLGNVAIARLYDATTGSDSITAADGANLVGVTQTAIPAIAGREFLIRFWGNFPNGMVYAQQQAHVGGGDFFNFSNSAADVTGTQTAITDSFAANYAMYGPIAVEMQTTRPTVAIIGDSRTSGYGDVPNTARGLKGNLPRLLGHTYAYMNLGVAGEMAQNWGTRRPRSLALAQHCSHVYLALGFNDVANNSRTGAQALADLQTLAALFPGKPVLVTTANPKTDTSNAPQAQAALAGFNSLLRGLPKPFVGLYDPAATCESLTTAGAWANTGFTTDYTHETSLGNERAAAAAAALATAALGGFSPVAVL